MLFAQHPASFQKKDPVIPEYRSGLTNRNKLYFINQTASANYRFTRNLIIYCNKGKRYVVFLN